MLKRSRHSARKFCTTAVLMTVLVSGIFASAPAQTASSPARDIQHLDKLLARADMQQDLVRVGDMRFKASTLKAYRDRLASSTTGNLAPRAAVHPWAQTWPGGIVPYAYDSSVSPAHQAEFEGALREWQLVARLNFVPRTTETDYIKVVSGNDGNWSWIGKIDGVQELHIQQWSDTGIGAQAKFLICHEIGHALGFIHEQSRSDRDNYVTIRADNVDTNTYGSDTVDNFDIVPGSLNQGTYDFNSIMHYRKDTFARPGTVTIQTLAGYSAYQNMMGQLTQLSTLDKSGMAQLYGPARSISGAIRSDSGAVVDAVTIRIDAGSPYRATNPVTTGGSGAYSFTGLPGGTYTITPTKPGYTMIPLRQVVKITTANAIAINFIALQGVRISGRVTQSGVGLAGVAVTRRNIITGAQVSVTTNRKGYYGFSNVPTGVGVAYLITASKAGYIFSTTRIMPLNESTPTNYGNVNFSATPVTAAPASVQNSSSGTPAAPSAVQTRSLTAS